MIINAPRSTTRAEAMASNVAWAIANGFLPAEKAASQCKSFYKRFANGGWGKFAIAVRPRRGEVVVVVKNDPNSLRLDKPEPPSGWPSVSPAHPEGLRNGYGGAYWHFVPHALAKEYTTRMSEYNKAKKAADAAIEAGMVAGKPFVVDLVAGGVPYAEIPWYVFRAALFETVE